MVNFKLEDFWNSTSEAVVVVKRDGRIVFANCSAESMFLYAREELIDKPIEILMPVGLREVHVGYRDKYFASPEKRPLTFRPHLPALRKDGSELFVNISVTPLQTAEGVVAVSLISDVTEQKLFEDEVRHNQKMEIVGRLTRAIAHDFNNLLTVIGGYSDLALKHLDGTENPARQDIEQIQSTVQRAIGLTRRLLVLGRRQVAKPGKLDVNALITGMQELLLQLVGQNIEMKLQLDPKAGVILADSTEMEQVVLNLAINAADAMPDGGKLNIFTKAANLNDPPDKTVLPFEPGAYAVIEITDTGVGMDEETQSHLFKPFFTTKEQGTGLGLSTMLEIIKECGGNIACRSQAGIGTTFSVYLPHIDRAVEIESPATKPAAQRHQTILLVEDEDNVRELVSRLLEAEEFTVLQARSGSEALSISERHPAPIHLLLTDVVMHGMNGRELAERLLTSRNTLKILFMSGRTENPIVRYGIVETGMHFLEKPFTAEVLSNKVRETLDSSQRFVASSEDRGGVLVVDDEEGFRTLLTEYLSGLGWPVTTAQDASEARLKLEKDPAIAIVLLDVLLPGTGGLELLSEIVSRKPHPTVIMISVVRDREILRQAMKIGAFDCVAKPFNFTGLEEILIAALSHYRYSQHSWWKRLWR